MIQAEGKFFYDEFSSAYNSLKAGIDLPSTASFVADYPFLPPQPDTKCTPKCCFP